MCPGCAWRPLDDESQEGVETIILIGLLQEERLSLSISETTVHVLQRLAVKLWRVNACMPVGDAFPCFHVLTMVTMISSNNRNNS